MTGLSTDETIVIEGDPPCSFCKTPRRLRAYMFANVPHLDCLICDSCIVALSTRLNDIGDPDPYRPQGKLN